MSLINEALKKAQRQRTDVPAAQPAPAPVGTNAAPVARIAKRRPPMPARTLVILIGGGASLLLMGGVFVFIFFLHGLDNAPEPSVAVRPPSSVLSPPPSDVSVQPAPSSVISPPSSVISAPPPPHPSVQLPPIAVPAPPPAPSSQLVATSSQLPTVSTPPAAPPATQHSTLSPQPTVAPSSQLPAPSSQLVPTANQRVYEFLEKLRVTGIRASETDPKVIMNDRVYRLNDIVDRPTQLRLTRIESSALTFVDASGFEYRKSF